MQPLTDENHLLQAIQQIKQGGSGLLTNYFAGGELARAWIERRALYCLPARHCLLLLRRDGDFFHLYHVACGPAALAEALAALDGRDEFGTALTADLVGRPADVAPLVGLYESAGFRPYVRLMRLVRRADPAQPEDYEDPGVMFAEPAEAAAVLAFLERLLDRFAEQIPTLEDVRAAIARRGLLVVRQEAAIAGVLVFETTGLSSVLRYWYVDGRWRERGMGARLIKTFFRLCRDSKRLILWVDAAHEAVVAKYRHYGFEKEGLIDQIMIRKREDCS